MTTRDRGAVDAVGLVILVVPMLAFALLVFYVGRNVDAQAQLRAATESAAHAAALERDPTVAQDAARRAFDAMVGRDRCAEPHFDITYREGDGAVAARLLQLTVACVVANDGFDALDLDHADQDVVFTAVATVDFFRASHG